MKQDAWIFRENSLDLLRLFAAAQVAILHSYDYLYPSAAKGFFLEWLSYFPGVPIFFFVSGYLISKSYEKSPSDSEYLRNRVLRLYPALVACVLINIIMVWTSGYFGDSNASMTDLGLLFFAKSTFFQFWNPDFMRQFGDGVLNGSLWTITVELQFYVITPLFYYLFQKKGGPKNIDLLILAVLFVVANRLLFSPLFDDVSSIEYKIYRISFIPWFYMFLVGMLFQRNFAKLSRLISRLHPMLCVLTYSLIAATYFQFVGDIGNSVNPVLFLLVVVVLFRLAYFMPEKSNKLLKGNDISYGIYIWHMPILNQMLYFGFHESYLSVVFAIGLSFIIALLSWRFIERPALGFKSFSLNETFKKYNS